MRKFFITTVLLVSMCIMAIGCGNADVESEEVVAEVETTVAPAEEVAEPVEVVEETTEVEESAEPEETSEVEEPKVEESSTGFKAGDSFSAGPDAECIFDISFTSPTKGTWHYGDAKGTFEIQGDNCVYTCVGYSDGTTDNSVWDDHGKLYLNSDGTVTTLLEGFEEILYRN